MGRVVIGVDPHKASNTLVVIDEREQVLAQQRFANDRAGYRLMKSFARAHRVRVWAVEDAGSATSAQRRRVRPARGGVTNRRGHGSTVTASLLAPDRH